MKKILFLTVALLTTLSALAQNSIEWSYNPSAGVSDMKGVGISNAGTFGAAMVMPVTSAMNGATITGINVPVGTATMKNIQVFVSTTTDFSKPVVTGALAGSPKVGMNEVQLTTPYTLTAGQNIYVGYTFTLTAANTDQEKFPILCASGEVPNSLFLGINGQWADYSANGFGVCGARVILSNYTQSATDAAVLSLTGTTAVINSTTTMTALICSNSSEAITSVGYSISYDGKTITGESKANIGAGIGKTGVFNVTFPTNGAAATQDVTITLTSINGQNITPSSAKGSLTQVSRLVNRLSVVEEFTGTGCGWCPRGWVGMGILKEELADKAAVIAIHQYNNTDPMYTAEYATPRFQGAPSSIVDRQGGECDPFYGPNGEGIKAYTAKCAKSVPEAEIKLTASFSSDMKTVTANASTEFLTSLDGASIVYVLTADGLTGTSGSWKQSNYYANYTAAQQGVTGTGVADFCKGGKYAQSSVTLVFDDVLLTSSWNSGGSINRAPAFVSTTGGSIEQNSYTLTIPTKTTLKAAIKYDQLYVTAFVLKADGTIANAARCKVEQPKYAATLSLATYPASEVGAKASANATITNYGTETITKVGYRYMIQTVAAVGSGVNVQRDTVYTQAVDAEAILTEPLKGGEFGSTTFPVEVVAPEYVSSTVSTNKLTNYVMVAITSLNDTKLDENNLTYATAVIRTVPVGIETIVNDNLNDNLDRFDLQGRRIKMQQRGITLERGLKVIR